MIRGIGTDIVEIKRVEEILSRLGERFAARILTESELIHYQHHHQPVAFLAKRFAAKEAVAKALGTGIAKGIGFQQIEVTRSEHGAPEIKLTGAAAERQQALQGKVVHLSLADEKDYAVAFAVLEG